MGVVTTYSVASALEPSWGHTAPSITADFSHRWSMTCDPTSTSYHETYGSTGSHLGHFTGFGSHPESTLSRSTNFPNEYSAPTGYEVPMLDSTPTLQTLKAERSKSSQTKTKTSSRRYLLRLRSLEHSNQFRFGGRCTATVECDPQRRSLR